MSKFTENMNNFFAEKKVVESKGYSVLPSVNGAYVYDGKKVICSKDSDKWNELALS